MDLTSLIDGVARGLGLVGLAAVIGGLVLDSHVIPPGLPDFESPRRRVRGLIIVGLVVLAVTTAADVVIRTQAMSRASFAVAIATVPNVLAGTHFGAVVMARTVLLGLGLLFALARPTPLRWLCLVVALAIALTTTLVGHAADWGDVTVSVAIDWAHAVSASAWTGGLIALALVLARREPTWPASSVAVLAVRFSRLAGVCLLVVIVTGSYNAWVQLGPWSRFGTTAYGRVLILKLIIVGVLAWLGATSRYVVLPSLASAPRARGFGARLFRVSRLIVVGPRRSGRSMIAPPRLAAYVTAEAIVAIGVFAG